MAAAELVLFMLSPVSNRMDHAALRGCVVAKLDAGRLDLPLFRIRRQWIPARPF